MKTRLRKVPATTSNLTKAIINFLLYNGHFAFRVNNGAVYDPRIKRFRKQAKGAPAISDIICVLKPYGYTLCIEIKNAETEDRSTLKQQKFRKEIMKRGGYHCFAYTYNGFLEYFRLNNF